MPRFFRFVLLIASCVFCFANASQAINYYTYTSAATSGAWNAAGTWTTDPSGISLTGSAVPGNGDAVYILNGFTVNLTANVTNTGLSVNINNGGTLNLETSTFTNTLTALAGSGTLRIKSGYFPAVTTNSFVNNAASGATVEYMDFTGTVPASLNFPNLKFIASSGSHVISISNSAGYTLTVYGTFTTQALGGTLTVTMGTRSVNIITLRVGGNVSIGANTTWNVFASVPNSANSVHNIYLSGDMTNDGTVTFNNNVTQYSSNNTGAANLRFVGVTDNVLACNGSTNLHNIFVDKGTSSTNILSVTSTNVTNLKFYSADILLNVTNGTLRLGANINLARIRDAGNYDLGSLTSSPMLWIDGATVSTNGSALVVYGKFRITDGSFNCTGGEGSVIRIDGQYLIEGGTFTTEKFRPSNTDSNHRGSFIMSGGTFNAMGTGSNASYARFSHPYMDQVFIMSGGTINVSNPVSSNNAGFHVGVKESNYNVTGGTINFILSGSATQFKILSTAPLYNLNISRSTTGPATAILDAMPTSGVPGPSGVTSSAQPLKVLNNLTIDGSNSPVLNANGHNVTIGGNFTINANATYTPDSNTTFFNGTANQQFNNSGTITAGIYNLVLDKAGGTLTLGGTASTYPVTNMLTLTKGVLNDGGKVVQVTGNISNSATHTGTGNITLSGAATQTLSGDGNGVYGNVILSNASSPGVTVTANLSISGTLTLAGNGQSIFDINQYTLSITSNSTTAVTTTGNPFSNVKLIRTLGLQSDGGVRKTFGGLSPFTYPVGAAGLYTPATIQLTTVPTSYGNITVKPVNSRNPFVVAGNTNNLTWYWRVSSSGFVGSPTFTHKYYYDESSVSPAADDANYIPARYNPTTWTKINDLTQVDEAANEITFAGVPYVEGDFTAGQSAAFGTVKVFYSKRNGPWFNVTAGVTPWSNASHTGPDATSYPGPGDHVYIGDGSTYNHTITVGANNANAGGLEISSGSTLDVGVYTGHNFGALEDAPVGGSGTLRISSNTATAQFPAGDFGNFIRASGGTIVYYSTGTQNFTIPLSSASPTLLPLITYRYLVLQPAAGRTITLPNQDVRVYNDLTVQGAASNAIAYFNGAAARNFTVNGNVSVTGGSLQIQNGAAQAIDVDGNISVSSGASFSVSAANAAVTNTMSVGGSLINNGTFDMSVLPRLCNVTFDGASNTSVTGTGATTDFNILTVAKGTTISSVLEVNATNFSLSGGSSPLALSTGTFRLTSTQSIVVANGTDFSVPASARLSANGGTMEITGGDGIDLLLAGTLEVLSGTINVGTTPNDNSIEYASTGLPTIMVGGGTLNIRAQVRRSTANAQGTLVYNQSGSSVVNAGISSAAATTRSLFELFGSGSSFNMTGGVLRLQRKNLGALTEFFLQPSAGSVTGGVVEFGDGSTGREFDVNTTIALNDLTVVGSDTVRLQTNPLTLRGSLDIAASAGLFLANSLTVSIAGDFTNSNTNATIGIGNGGFRAGNASQTTYFNGSSVAQSITGVSGNLTNFANLVISNAAAGGVVTLQSNTNIRVNGSLTLSSGTLAGLGNTITVLGTVSNSSTHTSTTGTITLAGTGGAQLITGNGSGKFGNVTLTNTSGAYFGANQEITGTLTFGGTSGSLLINSYALLLSGTSFTSIAGASGSRYIVTSGNLSDGGVTKAFASGVSGSFTYHIGVSGKYTPANYTLTTGDGGTITLRPVNSKHPNATGTGTAYLRYYWRVSTSAISFTSLTQLFTYLDGDRNGTEANYRDARFFGGSWSVGVTAGNPNISTNVITFTNITDVASDYTAGEELAFVAATTYTSIASGPWEAQGSVWTPVPPSATGPPPGSFIIIGASTAVTMGTSGKSMASLTIEGRLNLGTTNSHNFGTATAGSSGDRVMQLQTSLFPAGDFTQFNSSIGGTVEYDGVVTLSSTQATYNNLTFTGAGAKNLGNVNLTVNGNITINAGTVNNPSGSSITMTNPTGDFTNQGVFNAGSGTVTIGRDLNNNAGATFIAPNSSAGLKVMRDLTNSTGATFTAGTDSIGVRGSLVNAGAFTVGANAVRVRGNLSNTGGTFTGGAGAITIGGSLTNNAAFGAGAGAISVQGDLFNNGASAVYTANANSLSVNGEVNLAASAVFNAGTGTITTNGDWNNGATFNAGTGTVNFTGISNQHVTGATTFYHVSRTGADLTLNNNVAMGGILTLSTGNIVTGSNVLSLTNTSAQPVTGYSTSAWVDGGLSIAFPNTANESRVYPIASGGAYRPVTVQQTAASTTPVVYVRMTNTPPTGAAPTGVDRLSQARYYAIDLVSGTMNAPVIDLSFNTNGAPDEAIATPANARVLRGPAPSGVWTNEGGSGVFSPADPAGHVTSAVTSIGSSTYFTLGYPNEVTPVTLVSFEALLNSDFVELFWVTASEKNNDYFTIERSNESLRFDSLLTVKGAGDSQMLLNYSAVDHSPLAGVSYYRLKQTDYDLKYSYSKVVRIVNNHASRQLMSLYPNPAQHDDAIHLKVDASGGAESNLTITDALGRVYFSGTTDLSGGVNLRGLALQYRLQAGTYIIRVSWGSTVQTRKLIIQ